MPALGLGLGISFGGMGGFSPEQLGPSTLLAWYRADSGVTPNGATVSAWADLSGNGTNLAQANAARQPTFNATGGGGVGDAPYVSCPTNGTAISIASAGVPVYSQPLEIFVEASWNTSGGGFTYLCDSSANANTMAILTNAAANSIAIDAGTLVAGTFTPSGWQTYDAVINGASSSLTIAGTLVASGDAGTGVGAGGIILFNNPGLTASVIAGIAEYILCASLTASQRSQVISYLRSRYGNQ
jgi:hypothetical protein